MPQKILQIACIFGALAVVLGAFGSHGLKNILPEARLNIYEIGIRYQFYHALALFLAGFVYLKTSNKFAKFAAYFYIAGIFLFSGSLYLLASRSVLGIENLSPILGPMTPIGGTCFIIAWVLLALSVKDMTFEN